MIDSNSISGDPTLDKIIFCIKDNDVYFNSKTIITKKSEINNLNKNYDLYIDNFDIKCESINYDNLICNSIDFDITSKITSINSVKTSTLLTQFANLGSYGNIKTIHSKNFQSDYLNFKDNTNNIDLNEGTIYYKDNQIYTVYKNQQIYPLQTNNFVASTSNKLLTLDSNILNTDKVNSFEINTDNINTSSIKLPLVGNIHSNINNNNIGLLTENNNNLTIHDGQTTNDLLFNQIDGYYRLEYRYNKIKLESQFTNILINPDILYNIKIENNKMIIHQTGTYVKDITYSSGKFYIQNNKILTESKLDTFFTIFNLEKLGSNLFRADFKFDKSLDSQKYIDVFVKEYNFTNKIYNITTLPNNNNQVINKSFRQATSSDLAKNKYTIKNFQLYNINNSGLPIYLYNIVYNNNYLDTTLLFNSEIPEKINMINNNLNISNKSTFGYNLNYLNHNTIYKIKNSQIFTTHNINTDLVLINKRLNTGVITNNYKYT